MFTGNSLVLTWERNFEVTFGIFSVLVLVVMYYVYTPGHVCPGGVVHYYSYPLVSYDGTI